MKTKNKIMAVVWDFGDTLVTFKPSREELFHKATCCLGIKLSRKAIRDAYRIVDFSNKFSSIKIKRYNDKREFYCNYNRSICNVLGIATHFKNLQPLLEKTFENPRWSLFDDAYAVLEYLHSRGVPMAIAANWNNNLAELAENLGIAKFFRTIISSQALGIEKPDPMIFHNALDNIGLSNSKDVLYIGNEYEIDVVGAYAAGLVPVLIDRKGFYPHADCLRFDSIGQWLETLELE